LPRNRPSRRNRGRSKRPTIATDDSRSVTGLPDLPNRSPLTGTTNQFYQPNLVRRGSCSSDNGVRNCRKYRVQPTNTRRRRSICPVPAQSMANQLPASPRTDTNGAFTHNTRHSSGEPAGSVAQTTYDDHCSCLDGRNQQTVLPCLAILLQRPMWKTSCSSET